jgi:hypothetical protein
VIQNVNEVCVTLALPKKLGSTKKMEKDFKSLAASTMSADDHGVSSSILF